MKLVTEEQANAYEQATDGCRRLFLATRDEDWQRVKPDEESNPLAEVDWEKEPTRDEPLVTTPLLHLGSRRIHCIALVIQPLAISVQPTGKDHAAAK